MTWQKLRWGWRLLRNEAWTWRRYLVTICFQLLHSLATFLLIPLNLIAQIEPGLDLTQWTQNSCLSTQVVLDFMSRMALCEHVGSGSNLLIVELPSMPSSPKLLHSQRSRILSTWCLTHTFKSNQIFKSLFESGKSPYTQTHTRIHKTQYTIKEETMKL